MKFILMFQKEGDKVIAECNVVEEAEKIIREYQQKGCWFGLEDGSMPVLTDPLPDVNVFILFPISGG